MRTSYYYAIIAILKAFVLTPCWAEAESSKLVASEEHTFQVETFIEGLEVPWGLAEMTDGRLLVTERQGTLRIIENGELLKEPVSGIPEVVARGQGGLLDVALHPDFSSNGWIYLAFSAPARSGEGTHTKVVRGKLRGTAWVDEEKIFEAPQDQYTRGGNHFGCRIAFDGKGFIFFSIGERGEQDKAQRLNFAQGKIHRLHDDGRVPQDNPFVGNRDALPSIWTYGNRNAQGLQFQPGTGILWSTEHGPRGGDELNIVRKGANYGWPEITYGINYNGMPISDKTAAPGMEQPVIYWTPSIGVCGMDFYSGDKFPKWRGNLFVSGLAPAHAKVVRVVIDESQKVTHQEDVLKGYRIRHVRVLSDGYVYLLVENPGRILRLKPE